MRLHRRCFMAGAGMAAAVGPARAGEPVTIVLDWLPNPNHAALFAAQHTGAFARQGLAVSLIAPSDPDSPVRLVAAGQADVAVGYGSQINLVDAAGLPLVRIATLIDQPLNTVMALDTRIRSLASLKHRRIGLSVGGVEEALLDAMLASAGLQPGDVTIAKVNYGMVAALLSGRLDAAIGAYRNVEVVQVRRLGRTPAVFLPEQHGVPLYDELILVARRDRSRDPRLRRLVMALQAGTDALLARPGAIWSAFAAAHPELAGPDGEAGWAATMPFIAAAPARLDAARYLAFQDFAVRRGIVPAAVPLDRFAVDVTG